jgi:hypothetical protein
VERWIGSEAARSLDAGVQLGDAHDVVLHKRKIAERRRNGTHLTESSGPAVPSPRVGTHATPGCSPGDYASRFLARAEARGRPHLCGTTMVPHSQLAVEKLKPTYDLASIRAEF